MHIKSFNTIQCFKYKIYNNYELLIKILQDKYIYKKTYILTV